MATYTNLIRNPRGDPSGTAWSNFRSTDTQDPAMTRDGVPSIKVTLTNASGNASQATAAASVAEGQAVVLRAYARCSVASSTARVEVIFRTAANAQLVTYSGTYLPVTNTDWAEVIVTTAAAPATTDHALAILSTGGLTGEDFWFVQPMLEIGTTPSTYGDGTMDGWAWTGAAHQSASTGAHPAATSRIFPVVKLGTNQRIGPLKVG